MKSSNSIRIRMSRYDSFTMLPNVVLLDPKMKDQGVVFLYALLRMFSQSKGRAFPGQERLSQLMGVSDRTVRRQMELLKKRGLIKVERRGLQQTNIYWIEALEDVYSPIEMDRILSLTHRRLSTPDRTKTSGQDRTPMSYEEDEGGEEDRDLTVSVATAPEKIDSHFWKDMVRTLSTAILAVTPDAVPLDPKEYRAFAKLYGVHKVSVDRIRKAVAWYCGNHGKQYVPFARNSYAFVNKFNAIEAAMKREKNITPFPTPKVDWEKFYTSPRYAAQNLHARHSPCGRTAAEGHVSNVWNLPRDSKKFKKLVRMRMKGLPVDRWCLMRAKRLAREAREGT